MMPVDCHCYYTPATDKRGDCFVIDRHPDLDKRLWKSSGSKNISTIEKYEQLLNKLVEITNADNIIIHSQLEQLQKNLKKIKNIRRLKRSKSSAKSGSKKTR